MVVVAALDVGSGATKLLVARISKNPFKLMQVLYEKETEVLLAHDVESNEGFISEHTQSKCRDVLLNYKNMALSLGASRISGVGTQVFRTACNGADFLRSLKKQDIFIDLIGQQQEGHLGFLTAVALTNDPGIISWDSGGASFQITDGKNVFQGHLGTTVVTAALCHLQGKIAFNAVSTPNPVSQQDADLLNDYIYEIVGGIEGRMNIRTRRVIGIGGETCAFNMCRLAANISVSSNGGFLLDQDSVKNAIPTFLNLDDAGISNKGFTVQPSMLLPKLILVYNVMKIMQIGSFEYFQSTGSCLGYLAHQEI